MQIDNHNTLSATPPSSEDAAASTNAAVRMLRDTIDGEACSGATDEKLARLLQDIALLIELVHRDSTSTTAATEEPPLLTPRPREVLELIDAGKTPTQIGEELSISVRTVRRHIEILKKVLNEPRCHYRKLPRRARELRIL